MYIFDNIRELLICIFLYHGLFIHSYNYRSLEDLINWYDFQNNF
jgi:hypothetical protein